MRKTLRETFEEQNGKISDKWTLYLEEWDQLFVYHRDQQIQLFEIGIQNGGSLEIWAKYFLKAQNIVGCDVDEKCRQLKYDDDRITVVVCDANSDDCENQILRQAPTFDIIIDDGSHKSSDIVRSFARYFPHLNDNGIYVVEDLHASYWKDYEGGLHDPLSAMAFFKRLADVVNYEHWRNNKPRWSLLKMFAENLGIDFEDLELARIHSIEFINSLCIIKKLPYDRNDLGKRIIVGTDGRVTGEWKKLNGSLIQDFAQNIKDDENLDVFELIASSNSLTSNLAEKEQAVQTLLEQIAEKDRQFAEQLQEKEKQSSAQLAEKDRQFAEQLQEKEKQSSVQLAEKDQEIQQFVTQINQKDGLIKAFYAQVAEIYGSTGWLLVQFLWRIRDFLTPPGTFREKVVRKIGKFLFSGLRKNNILRKTKNFLQSKSQNNNNVSLPVDPIPNASIQNSMPLIIQEPQALQTIINSEVVIEQTPSPIQISSMDIDTIISERFWFSNPLRGFSIPHPERRLNLVTDSINSGSLFGGVATSIIFSAIMAGRWNCELRVITRTEIAHKQNFQRILETNGISFSRNVEFLYAPSANRHSEIPVGEGDVFLTTSWWTTQSIKDTFGEKKILYLLQEDERAFYPFGDERLRCENILKSPNIKFIINSKLLFDHLVSEGFENIRENGLWFEPSFSNALFHIEEKDLEQKSNFFFYARPNNIRNLFYLGLEVIEKAVTKGILNPDEWNFHFVGKNIPEIRIDSTHLPFIFQNLSLLDYASLARKVDLGFCLMYTPHPSYPPLDLAACGAVVITNRFGLKQNLDQYSKNIFCCELDSDSLVQGIEQGIQLSKSQQRYKNFADNQILRDWYTSFKDVLIPLDKWSSNVSY